MGLGFLIININVIHYYLTSGAVSLVIESLAAKLYEREYKNIFYNKKLSVLLAIKLWTSCARREIESRQRNKNFFGGLCPWSLTTPEDLPSK